MRHERVIGSCFYDCGPPVSCSSPASSPLSNDEHLQFSGAFDDPIRLLETCGKMGFEGIVSKRKESAYRSGPTCDWLKIKTATWREANRDRWELFEKRRG